ncbi:uncharacterized protein LOC124645166 [Helicoverpa zea]|uniref:uncharacterized protein LOC124645166 n=1 Tax=Helicoverpa zea TaxID=7113 RepID=UPI001F579A31|nr:uncharacterized protein LOC124645166 [Helicoverpa zea]XP_049697182.1 uncharacterized protein LOC126054703 [Helicoverpa armigera]
MVQTVLNRYCLSSKSCCFCITLKVGTILIAIAGLLPSVSLLLAYGAGDGLLVMYGVDVLIANIILHLYAILGILLCGVNIILLIAAITYNEKLILLYLWFAWVYFVVDFGSVLVISISAISKKFFWFGMTLFFVDLVYWISLYLYVFPVVNGFRKNIHTIVIYLT